MALFKRLFGHFLSTSRAAKRAFPGETLEAIQSAIGDGEQSHRAQLKLIIEPALPLSDILEGTTPRGRAHMLFSRYRIWDTEENSGVLIYINLADRAVEIVTDRGVGRVLHQNDWEEVCTIMTQGFAQHRYHDSALAGINHVNRLLVARLPASGFNTRTNELSDRPVIL
jgi:uncharacterized membrane protein